VEDEGFDGRTVDLRVDAADERPHAPSGDLLDRSQNSRTVAYRKNIRMSRRRWCSPMAGARPSTGRSRASSESLRTTAVTTVKRTPSRALVIADGAHVVWAVNLGCLGFHVQALPRRGP
jgi:hypothetical protein